MKTYKPKSKLLLLLLSCWIAILLPNAVKAQYSCSTALSLDPNYQMDFLTQSNDNVWVSFTGTADMKTVWLRPAFPTGAFPNSIGDHVDTIEVYKGSICGSLSLMYTYVRPAGQLIRFNFAFVAGTHYFLRISTGCKCDDQYILSLIQYGPSVCESSCNLSCNGNLDLTTTASPIGPYPGNMGFTGCWNSFFNPNLSPPDWDYISNYAGSGVGAGQGTPDYFNVNSTPPIPASGNYLMDVPNNFMGTQAALTGAGYAGVYSHITWPNYFNSPLSTGNYGRYYREYIQQELCDSMIAGHKYTVTLSISLADESAISTYIGVLFSADTIWQPDPPASFPVFFGMPYNSQTPQWETPTQVTNMTAWTTYTFNYTATANHKHMSVGNFRQPSASNLTQINSNVWYHYYANGSADSSQVAYYYIDGISVVPFDSIIQNKDTSFLCLGYKDTLFSYLSSPNPYIDYSWTSFPTDTSLVNWLANPSNPDSMVIVQPVTNTTYFVTINDTLYHCVYMDTFYIQVGGFVLDSLLGNTFKCDTIGQYILYSSSADTNVVYNWLTSSGDVIAGNGNDTITINWSASLGSDSWVYVTATDTISGCVSIDSLLIKSCCVGDPSGTMIYNDTASVLFGSGDTIVFFRNFNINGTFVVDINMSFFVCQFNMGPNAKIIVTGGHKLFMDKDTIKAGCCEMWDAIIGESLTDTVEVSGCYMGDAIRGVTSYNGSVFKCHSDNTFNRNLVSITVNPYSGNHKGTVSGTTFTSVSLPYCPTTNGKLLPPYSNTWPLYGVSVTAVDSITIGDPFTIGYINTYTKLRHGIRTKNTNVKIYNNQFIDINKAGGASKAVWCVGRFPTITPFNFTQYTVNVGGTSLLLAQKNYFINCPNGVFTDTAMSTIVTNNKFNYNYPSNAVSLTGVAVNIQHCTGLFRVIDVNGDSINNYATGVLLYYNQKCKARVRNNMITRTQVGYFNCNGIVCISNGANRDTVIVANNTMRNVRIGVRMSSVNRSIVRDNLIYLRPTTTASQPNRGISLENCHKDMVIRNDIYKENPSVATTNLWIGGVFLTNSDSCTINCNNVFRIGYGIRGDGAGTVNGTFFNNYMNQENRGIWLSNGPVIGQQGSPTVASDNRWTGPIPFTRLYSSGTTFGNFSNFYYRPSPPNSLAYTPSGNYDGTGAVISFTATSTPIPPFTNCNYIQQSGGSGTSQMIAQGQITYTGNQNSGTWLSRQGLYSILLDDSVLTASSPILTNFRDSADQHNIGTFHRAMKVYSNGSMSAPGAMQNAYQAINNLTPSNVIEENLQVVEHILLRHEVHGGRLTVSELDTLRAIAQLCPYTDGNAVYMARGIIYPYDMTEYENSCEMDEGNGNRIANPSVEPADTVSFLLYPNPNNGEINIEYSLNEGETGTMNIYATTGQLVKTIYLIPGQNQVKIILAEMDAGLYLYDVRINGELRKTDRIVIMK